MTPKPHTPTLPAPRISGVARSTLTVERVSPVVDPVPVVKPAEVVKPASPAVNARHDGPKGTATLETAPASAPTQSTLPALGARSFAEHLELLAATPGDIVTVARQYVDLIARLPQVAGVAIYFRAANGTYSRGADNWSGFALERNTFQNGVGQTSADAAQTGRMRTFVQADARNMVTFCLPVRIDRGRTDALSISVAIPFEDSARYDVSLFNLAAASLALWHSRGHSQRLDADLQATAAIVELVAQLERSATIGLAGHTLVNELREFLQCDQVALALTRPFRGGCTLQAVSGLASFDGRSESIRATQAASDEATIRRSLATWPPLATGTQQATLGLRKLTELLHVEASVSVPLITADDRDMGVLTLTGSRGTLHEPRVVHFLRTAAPALAGALRIVQRLEGSRWQRATRAVLQTGWVRLLGGALAAGAVGLALLMPWPYRVRTTCTLEPMVRRVVAAPYEGLLELSLVEPGDIVERDQILARMDGREIRWELSGVAAERHQTRREWERQLADENIPKAQLAALDGERLDHKARMLQHRLANHELRAPVDGIVLKGSIERMSSAPVKLGQPLFEVGQLHPLRLDLALPAEEFANVRAGHQVQVSLDGMSDRKVEAEIKRIRPRSEIRDGQNVFIAEVEIDNEDQRLRPGIQGTAVITGDSHALGWNLFHRAWEGLTRARQGYLLADGHSVRDTSPTLLAGRDQQFDKRRRTNMEAPEFTDAPPTQIAARPASGRPARRLEQQARQDSGDQPLLR